MAKATGTCAVCGAAIEFFPSQKRKTCSRRCAALHTGKVRRELGLGGQPRPLQRTGTWLNCQHCGKDYYKAHNAVEGSKYCSPDCRSASRRKPRMERPCEYCGKTMYLLSNAHAQERRHCSRRCDQLDRTKSWKLLDRTYNGMPVKQDPKGYIWLWAPERGLKEFGWWYREHRMVVEAKLGRRLAANEHVHHINGIKYDNRLENLAVMSHEEHATLSLREHEESVKASLAELEEYRKRFGALTEA